MASDVWLSLTTLGGVALGGGLSFLVQTSAQRSADRAAERRQVHEVTEGRRAERLAQLEKFVEVAAQAERCAFTRPDDWTETGDDPWWPTTQDVMRRFWIAERMIRLHFPAPVHDAARAHFLDHNRAVWEGLPPGENLAGYLDRNRGQFLDAARAEIG